MRVKSYKISLSHEPFGWVAVSWDEDKAVMLSQDMTLDQLLEFYLEKKEKKK